MISNRSVPVDTVLPHIVYENVEQAIAWLHATFGFIEHFRYGDPAAISGAQIHLGNAWIQVVKTRAGRSTPAQVASATQMVTVFVEDVDAHFEKTRAAGAKIVEDLHETEYGECQYGVLDLAGHLWLFAKHVRDVDPAQWGATLAEIHLPASQTAIPLDQLPRPRVCYFEIPATDPHRSADFYEAAFGWRIRHRGTDHPSFDDAANVSGAFLRDRPIARDPGLLPYVWVDSIEETLEKIVAAGGELVDASHPDHPGGTSNIATFRDPAGNLIGLYQESPAEDQVNGRPA